MHGQQNVKKHQNLESISLNIWANYISNTTCRKNKKAFSAQQFLLSLTFGIITSDKQTKFP